MSDVKVFRTTNCPACGTGFKYPYHAGQNLYRMSCRKAACGTRFEVDITPFLTEKVIILRGKEQTATVLELPDGLELTGTVEK